ncbi:FkbM family methyltransferase [Sphingobium phenoxybenzoativorans]|uniref:FkbM family methyltransferase n=1 Tax=Sphingobium phenoxybenzoativorans TaxID=1592790 RepID=A0A975K5K7_9SPHN|nr:FkbM family methyltransferase [Sphingobium phenoxybenzoativorans]QUT04892.1 FkbM family methyltransferase [Sphingobium phenoxybenzoativorans]
MLRQARNFMLEKGFWSERTAELGEVAALVRRMRPMQSSIPLRRLGGANGGGYLIPDDLEGIKACISPGVWIECTFDEAVADLGLDVLIADAAADGPPARHDRFTFTKKSVDSFTGDDRITMDDLCRNIRPGEDLLLDMDIEGAEYRVLSAISDDLLSRFRIMTIEFHHLGNMHTPFGLSEIGGVFDRLLRTHNIVHIHPNNSLTAVSRGGIAIPPVMEFTFLRRDRGSFTPSTGPFPHPLDATTEPHLPEVVLPACWYAN